LSCIEAGCAKNGKTSAPQLVHGTSESRARWPPPALRISTQTDKERFCRSQFTIAAHAKVPGGNLTRLLLC
jgi:hypothetical protein